MPSGKYLFYHWFLLSFSHCVTCGRLLLLFMYSLCIHLDRFYRTDVRYHLRHPAPLATARAVRAALAVACYLRLAQVGQVALAPPLVLK